MAIYCYALHNDAGPDEHLGFIDISNDQDAIEFGREVVIGILQEPDPAFGRVTLEITVGSRQIDSVPLELACAARLTTEADILPCPFFPPSS